MFDVAWLRGNALDVGSKSPDYGTHTVATLSPNELGLYDMSGNVREWCADKYGSYTSGAVTNPTGPESGWNRVKRGGGWYNYQSDCRVSSRGGGEPTDQSDRDGLRLVL